jgi:hypothetical protein
VKTRDLDLDSYLREKASKDKKSRISFKNSESTKNIINSISIYNY